MIECIFQQKFNEYIIKIPKHIINFNKFNNNDYINLYINNCICIKLGLKQIINQYKTIKFCNLYDANTDILKEFIVDNNNIIYYYIAHYRLSHSDDNTLGYSITLFKYNQDSNNNNKDIYPFIKNLYKLFVLKLF